MIVSRILERPPRAGCGVHKWLFQAALSLSRQISPGDAEALITARIKDCGRFVSSREICEAVKNAYRRAPVSIGAPRRPEARLLAYQPPKRWPDANPDLIRAALSTGRTKRDLTDASPVSLTESPATETIIDAFFATNELLCIGPTLQCAMTKPRHRWRGRLATFPFIVPNPMSAPLGRTQSGRTSPRSLENAGPRRFVVVEFDFKPDGADWQRPLIREVTQRGGTIADLNAAIILTLARCAPLSLVVFSGNKSLHGWFHVADWPKAKIDRFSRLAVAHGADTAPFTVNQFVRMPDAMRDNGQRQAVLYFDPLALAKSDGGTR